MRKGVAIPYIIAVLLGIAVIGIIGYWFFVLGGNLGTNVTTSSCQTKLTVYCTAWVAEGYAGNNPRTLGKWDNWAKGCTTIGVPETEPDIDICQKTLGSFKKVGDPCTVTPDNCGSGLKCTATSSGSTTGKCEVQTTR